MSSSARKHLAIDHVEDVENADVESVFSTPVALSYDHILEQILNSLGSKDLLNCRLVSHRWLFFAQKPLQKQICLRFYDESRKFYNSNKSFSKHLTQLTALLKKGQSLPDCEFDGHIPIIFPCSRFYMEGTSPSNDDLQQFLNTNGKNIRELWLNSFPVDTQIESKLMDKLTHLLLRQAPNIQIIHLSTTIPMSPFQHSGAELNRLCQKASDLLQSSNGSSLKVLEVKGWAKVLEFLIRISPKLEEVILFTHYYSYLIEPENRLYLLKSLRFGLSSSAEEMEKISCGVFKLKRLEINLERVNMWIQNHSDLEPKVAQMLNRIFQGSWDTLEEIKFNEFTFLGGMTMPEVMPKVKEIQIRDTRYASSSYSNGTIFPFGFNFQKTFPKLNRLHLAYYPWGGGTVESFSCFLNCLNFGADPSEPLSMSVKKVTLSAACFKNKRDTLHPSIIQRIKRWFPNALVEI